MLLLYMVKNTDELMATVWHPFILLLIESLHLSAILMFNFIFLLLMLTTLFQYEIGCSAVMRVDILGL